MSKYGFIGLGLIGGSLARALKSDDPSNVIAAYNRSEAPLEEAFPTVMSFFCVSPLSPMRRRFRSLLLT